MAKKERIEIQLDQEKDKKLLQFIDENGSTRAGFIKFVLRHYMNTIKGNQVSNLSPPEEQQKDDLKNESDSKNEQSKKRKAPKLGSSISSNDFE